MKTDYKRLQLFTDTGYLVYLKTSTVGDVVEKKEDGWSIIETNRSRYCSVY